MTHAAILSLLRVSAVMMPVFWCSAGLAQSTTATISQTGNGSAANVDQSGALGAAVQVEQIGDVLVANIVQRDAAHRLRIKMEGADQSAELSQSGAGLNRMEVDMGGSANRVTATQQSEVGGENVALLSQYGTGNQALIAQQAAVGQNYLTLNQNGNDNTANLSQTGGDNQLGLTQNGDGNAATLSQQGIGLILGIIQNGGANTVITQTGPGG